MSVSFYVKNKKKFLSYEPVLNVEEALTILNEVKQIQQEGEQNRRLLDNELQNLETTLKNQIQNR